LPCFDLDSCLQPGVGGAPKWEPKSCLGIYVGHSPSHAGSVALILNPQTGHVSPQCHVVFDDHFTTVPFMEKNEVAPSWAQLIKKSCEKVTEEHYKFAKTWLFPDPKPGNISLPEQNQDVSNNSNGTFIDQKTTGHNVSQNLLSTGMQPSIFVGLSGYLDAPGISQVEDYIQRPLLPPVSSSCDGEMTLFQSDDSLLFLCLINLETSGLRQSPRLATINRDTQDGPAIVAYTSSPTQLKSQRITGPKPRLSFLSVFNSVGARWNFVTLNPHSENEHLSFMDQIANKFEQINELFDNTINAICHQIQAYTPSNESFTYSQMLQEADHTKFFEAMEIKISIMRIVVTGISCYKNTYLLALTIMAIWLFKCKRFPNGMLNKHKARLFAHGGQQTWGQDYGDTYAPVVTLASVRLLLIVAKIHGLKSKSIDFVLAFPQADLDVPVYMELPAGVNPASVSDGDRRRYILKLNKSLYGLKPAGYNWFEKLREGLITRDFIQSQVDKCVFF
jgi:hypothetical protein